MVYFTIFALTLVVFASRYLFIEPRVPLRLSHNAQRFLSYASPAVLTAIWAPIVFIPDGEPNFEVTSPYVLAAIVCVALSVWKKNVLLTTLLGMAFFLCLKLTG
ncbi:AzlD domain-containing protein [Vibrio tapetis subsp. quintayensis]|uniref:AzlD domain-containing protein n=1 Tax=Vibrio tapetis TaxID=52443 RepID=UPI0025B53AF0|nr:AzlD domain-containing protein [Vibrio tapetis]MDN3680645.1 AzlD domain-containing protein [Vibrio tapetis subsp. quintayensis]